jgi:hypothetical protein
MRSSNSDAAVWSFIIYRICIFTLHHFHFLNRTIYKLPDVFYIHCAWSPITGNLSLVCCNSYQSEKHITVKIWKFIQRMQIINRILKPSQTQKHIDWKYITPVLFFLGGSRGTRTPKNFVNLTGESKTIKWWFSWVKLRIPLNIF